MAIGDYTGPAYFLTPVQNGLYGYNTRWFSAEDLRVVFEDNSGNLGEDLVYGVDYTVSPSGYSLTGGVITLLAAIPADTLRLMIDVDTAPGQSATLPAAEGTQEIAINRQAMILQEQVAAADSTVVTITASMFAWETMKRRRIQIDPATIELAGLMSAADKARLEALVNSTGTLDPAAFASQVQAEASDISDTEIAYLRTAGKTTAGDGGGGLFKRALSEPTHPGKLQSADGSWWEHIPEYRIQDYRAFGTGHSALNDAMAFLSANGGGEVQINEDTTITGALVGQDNVRLTIPDGITLTVGAIIAGAAIQGTNVPGFQIGGGGNLDIQGNADEAVLIQGPTRHPIDGLEVNGHKTGVRIEATAAAGLGRVKVSGFKAHDNFVHPTNPATQSFAGHALSITCRPSEGGPLTEQVILEDIDVEGVAIGATDGLNQYTKDLISVQGAKIVHGDRISSRKSGEVGFSATFGCQYVTLKNTDVEDADGHGIILSGAHYRIDISGITGGPFQVGETVQGQTSLATGVIEYLHADHMWLQSPSRAKIQKGETVQGATSLATATVDESFYARKLETDRSVRARRNGLDVHGIADYAGVTAQHVEQAFIEGTFEENKPFGMIVNSTDFQLGEFNAPVSATQTKPINDVGQSVFLGKFLSPIEIDDLFGETGNSQNNAAIKINGDRQLEAVQNGEAIALLNRTGDATTQYGDVIRVARAGVVTFSIGTDGFQFPQNTATGAFSHGSLPDASAADRKINYSTSSNGSAPALVRAESGEWLNILNKLPSRSTVWTRADLELETGASVGGMVYVSDGDQGHPALAIYDGAGWAYMPIRPPANVATIPDAQTSVTVAFGTARTGTDYQVDPVPRGNEMVWIDNKTVNGFDIVRAGSSGALPVEWSLTSYANP